MNSGLESKAVRNTPAVCKFKLIIDVLHDSQRRDTFIERFAPYHCR